MVPAVAAAAAVSEVSGMVRALEMDGGLGRPAVNGQTKIILRFRTHEARGCKARGASKAGCLLGKGDDDAVMKDSCSLLLEF